MPPSVCPEDQYLTDRYICQPCETKYVVLPGYEFNPNCGLDDRQNPVTAVYKKCNDGTFNIGSTVKCQKCSVCSSQHVTAAPCSTVSDTVCCTEGEYVVNGTCVDQPVMTTVTTGSPTEVTSVSIHGSLSVGENSSNLTGVWICVGALSILVLMCLLFIQRKQTKRCSQDLRPCCHGKSEVKNEAKKSFNQSASYSKINENSTTDNVIGSSCYLLAPEIQAAPLSTVLNNLDVLQELVLLLDPDIAAVKNTRHLAAQCSFSFAWINYAYSMKDHKSPLVAVLEGVVTKKPDWTVGHLAGLLTGIGRNDAVEILARLPLG